MPDATAGDDLVVGIDLGGTKALGVVLDPTSADGPLLVQRVPTPRGADALIEALDGLAADLGKQARATTAAGSVRSGWAHRVWSTGPGRSASGPTCPTSST